jgi:hypothetical protein
VESSEGGVKEEVKEEDDGDDAMAE